jgi:hypothetical protein
MEGQVKDASLLVAKVLVETDEDALKEEHEGLYNLLGDPATRLRYPSAATVTLGAVGAPGTKVSVSVSAGAISAGKALITLETRRSAIRGKVVDGAALEAMSTEAAFQAMAKNYAIASNKIVASKEIDVTGGAASLDLEVPKTKGAYVVKVLVRGDGKVAVGHAELTSK